MPHPLYKKIRDIIETTPGLTQRGLAHVMGVNPAAVNRMLYGRRKITADEIPVIENYLGQSLSVTTPFGQGRGLSGRRVGISDIPQQAVFATTGKDTANFMPMVPVYDMDDFNTGHIVDHVPQFPTQMGCRDAFAIYVMDDVMAPRYFKGEVVYIHPTRPAQLSKDCFIQMEKGDVFLAQFMGEDEKHIAVKKYTPTATLQKIQRDKVAKLFLVVGRG